MKKETIYSQWKERRRQVSPPGDFTATVMARIERQAHGQDDEMPFHVMNLPTNRLQWSTAAGLVMLGLFRILYIVVTLLRPHLIMP